MTPFVYDEAFRRNAGLLSAADQSRLRRARVAIAGMGGVGGWHALTLARQGVERFTISDPDVYELVNFNRQAGARMSTIGSRKVEVMAAMIREINPDADITIAPRLDRSSVAGFVEGADVVIDGLDAFAIDVRRVLFQEARRHGRWVFTAGPLGFGAVVVGFAPDGVSFDEHCDLRDGMSEIDQLVAFFVGIAPAGLHLPYLDLRAVDVAKGAGPSAALACMLCASLTATEVIKVVCGRGEPLRAPEYLQLDAYRRKLVTGKVRFGNRSPIQLAKRALLKARIASATTLDESRSSHVIRKLFA